ncbi:hypothetical protein Goshw_013226, partial [Gossypium schwendimanii]|nr:hypothetical protein [Gossypium schwendimanii]
MNRYENPTKDDFASTPRWRKERMWRDVQNS